MEKFEKSSMDVFMCEILGLNNSKYGIKELVLIWLHATINTIEKMTVECHGNKVFSTNKRRLQTWTKMNSMMAVLHA